MENGDNKYLSDKVIGGLKERRQGKNPVHHKQWQQLAHLSPDDERSHVHGSGLCVDIRHREEQATDPPDWLPICKTGAYLRT